MAGVAHGFRLPFYSVLLWRAGGHSPHLLGHWCHPTRAGLLSTSIRASISAIASCNEHVTASAVVAVITSAAENSVSPDPKNPTTTFAPCARRRTRRTR